MADETCSWTDRLGNTYVFKVYPWDANWNDVAGVYIAAAPTGPTTWAARYVGQADSFLSRLTASHDGLKCAKRSGATHIHAMVVTGSVERDNVEKLLIQSFNPSCNTQHRTDA